MGALRLRRALGYRPLHFVLGGLLLYLLIDPRATERAVPEPVTLDAAAQQQLRASWSASMGREPTAAEFAGLLRQELDDEVLFREALALGIHRRDPVVRQRLALNMRFLGSPEDTPDDELVEQALAMDMQRNDVVVRRRLVQVMEFSLGGAAQEAPVSEAEFEAAYAEQREELVEPARWSILQVYFSADRRGERAASDARAALAGLRTGEADDVAAVALGDPFLGGHRLPLLSASQLAGQFGPDFVAGLAACREEQWCGPVPSSFGQHLVRILAEEPERLPGIEEPGVRRRLEAEVLRRRSDARLASALDRLRHKYGVGS